MSTLFGLLHSGATSLGTAQQGVALSGNNVANARIPGYARRELVVDEGRGSAGGARVGDILRSEDFVLSQKIASQHGTLLNKNLMASGLREIEQAISAGQSNLSQKVTELGRAFSELAVAPSDIIRRSDAMEKGRAVAAEFNRIADLLGRTRNGNRDSAHALVQRINDLATSVSDLNRQIMKGSGGFTAVDAIALNRNLDARERAAQDLAGLTGGEIIRNKDGTLNVLVGGLSLVHGTTTNQLSLVDQTGGLRVLIAGHPPQLQISGELGGYLLLAEAASVHLGHFDRLAFDLSAAINAQHAFGVGLDGVGARPYFEQPAAMTGAARAIRLDPALSPHTLAAGFTAQAGDNRNALALSSLIDQPVLEGGRSSFRSVYSRIVTQLGHATQRMDGEAALAKQQAGALNQAREAALGVATDEEMTRLLAYQRGFEANARFIRVIDEMLQQLISL